MDMKEYLPSPTESNLSGSGKKAKDPSCAPNHDRGIAAGHSTIPPTLVAACSFSLHVSFNSGERLGHTFGAMDELSVHLPPLHGCNATHFTFGQYGA